MSNDVFEPVESDEEQDYDSVPGDTSFLLKVSDSSGVVNLSAISYLSIFALPLPFSKLPKTP